MSGAANGGRRASAEAPAKTWVWRHPQSDGMTLRGVCRKVLTQLDDCTPLGVEVVWHGLLFNRRPWWVSFEDPQGSWWNFGFVPRNDGRPPASASLDPMGYGSGSVKVGIENRLFLLFLLMLARRYRPLVLEDESSAEVTGWPETVPIDPALLRQLGLDARAPVRENLWRADAGGKRWFVR